MSEGRARWARNWWEALNPGGVRLALPSFACAKNGVKLTACCAGSIKYLPPVI